MRVELLRDVKELGKLGDVVDVHPEQEGRTLIAIGWAQRGAMTVAQTAEPSESPETGYERRDMQAKKSSRSARKPRTKPAEPSAG